LPAQQPSSALVVDPDPIFVSQLAPIITSSGYRCIAITEFAAARLELYMRSPDVLLANLRLGAFNGIHLAYLANQQAGHTRDGLRRERSRAAARSEAGAFCERSFVPYALSSFLMGMLPARDRRDVIATDRRQIFRGGRAPRISRSCTRQPDSVSRVNGFLTRDT
jgi:DNA-binding NtrC family response regulator